MTDVCIRGCAVPGRHLDCTCAEDGHEHSDDCDQCDGCQPRETESGNLCRPDLGRIRRVLLEAPDLVAWVADNVERGQGQDDRVTGSREAPAPLNVTAVDHVDEVIAVLASWVVTHADEAGLKLPEMRWARTVDHRSDRVVGAKTAESAPTLAAELTGWHLTYLDSFAGRPYAGDWHDEVVDVVGRARRAFPTRDRPRKVPVPCPECQRLMLHLHPPKGDPEYRPDGSLIAAHDITVICHADDCGKAMGQAEYYLVKRSAMTAAHERAEAEKRVAS